MLSNKIAQQIEKIPYFDRSGAQSITFVEDARKMVAMIPVKDRRDPATTYQDVGCGTGLDALVLAEQLMKDLQHALPDAQDRLSHIFHNQIFLSDVNPIQARIARANIKHAVNDMCFEPNVEVRDCFQNKRQTTYTFGTIDFSLTNRFVECYLELSEHVVIITRANDHRYVNAKLCDIDAYQFLRKFRNDPPICAISIPSTKKTTGVTFINGKDRVKVKHPRLVPTFDFQGWRFAQEVLEQDFPGYAAQSGPENNDRFNPTPGTVPLVFKNWMDDAVAGKKLRTRYNKKNEPEIVEISKTTVTANMGFSTAKLMVPKNGNLGRIPNFYYDAQGTLACSAQVNWIAMDKKEFDKLTDAINNVPCYNTLFKAVLVKTHTKDFWSKIPKIQYLTRVRKIYDKYYN